MSLKTSIYKINILITNKFKTMDFGEAIKALNEGKRVQRKGWNGKGMHIYKEDMFVFPDKLPKDINPSIKRTYEPCIILYTTHGTHQPGWNASTSDIFSDDWQIVN